LKTQARLDTELIELVLDDALNRFVCMVVSDLPNTRKRLGVKHKFKHVTSIDCVLKHMGSIYAEYYLCSYMDALIWFQDHIHRAGDFHKYSLHMGNAEFDYHLEFACIQKIFASVIIKEIILDTGHFYYGQTSH
jgi:hypothetical protein